MACKHCCSLGLRKEVSNLIFVTCTQSHGSGFALRFECLPNGLTHYHNQEKCVDPKVWHRVYR